MDPGSQHALLDTRAQGGRTLTTQRGDLGERVVAAVALAAQDAGLAGALACVGMAGAAV